MRTILEQGAAGAVAENEPLLDIEQAARFLNVSETSLRRWTNDGRLACLRVGRRRERRFRRTDLLAFMESEPAGRRRAGEDVVRHGMHLCGLYSSEEGQVQQAVGFMLEGLQAGAVTFFVSTPGVEDRILAELRRQRPELVRDVAEGRLVVTEYRARAAEQLRWWEDRLSEAVRRGATALRAIGDAGAFATMASREELREYELAYDERISRRFPIVTMCQYDVRLFSGPMILDTLKVHPDCFRHPTERIFA